MARPKKAPDERRTERLPTSRVTALERAFIDAAAAEAGLDTAEYVRRVVLAHRVEPRKPAADEAAIYELNRIGHNLNQIKIRFHVSGRLPDSMGQTLADIRAAVDRVAGP